MFAPSSGPLATAGSPASPLQRTGFHVEISEVDATVFLRLQGELDVATADQLRNALATAMVSDATKVVLDLADLTFMDSTGLAAVLTASRWAESEGRCLRLRNPTRCVRKLLRLSGFDQFLVLEPALDAG